MIQAGSKLRAGQRRDYGMKRITAFIVAALLAFSLAACSAAETGTSTAAIPAGGMTDRLPRTAVSL